MHRNLNSLIRTYGSHYIDEKDILAVTEVLRGSHLTCGRFVEQFERDLAVYCNSRYAISCSNGTTALHLASAVAGIGPDDCVIVPAITFVATANAPHYCGAKIIFCDVDPTNGIATLENLKASIATSPKKPSAFFPVDLAGQPSTTYDIKTFCQQYGIKIIQDACHSLGSTFFSDNEEVSVGSNCYSDFTTFSFHPVKNITTGEGGAILTNDEEACHRIKTLRSHGMLRDSFHFIQKELAFDNKKQANPWYYEMHEVGYNYRLTDIQAALGISQLNKLTLFKRKRQELKELYDKSFSLYAPFLKPVKIIPQTSSCWHLYSLLIDFSSLKKERAEVMGKLLERGIGTQVHYIPVHLQPYYRAQYPHLKLEGAEEYYSKTLSLPLHMHLTEEDIAYISNNLLEVLNLK